ncbi:UNVERIFIED_CONTAM: hypothetical protein GTU68_044236 [Idotea baltica]|nr:hypothetical protein [Idotea baltica]
MYVCGITVYDFCHIGHARMFIVFDVLFRHLKAIGFDVNYVRNITDVDDKIIARAAENNQSVSELTTHYIDAMHKDEAALSVLRPTHEPRATGAIDDMIALIEKLIEMGYAYAAENGDVFYSVGKFEGYGQLSGRKLEDMRAGERVAVDQNKQDPMDFVLWKSVKPGEPSWPSPWGEGRPGWHIQFDIHGGGMDLQFPHHENEKAQSEAAHGCTFANYWMHNGFVRVDEEKMSKSLDNFFTVRDVLEDYTGEEVRFFIINSHYRSALNYSNAQLDASRAAVQRLYTALRGTQVLPNMGVDQAFVDRFDKSMNDDLNTAEAFAVLFDIASEINKLGSPLSDRATVLANTMRALGDRLGLLQLDPDAALQGAPGDAGDLSATQIDALIEERIAARVAKDFARGDEIRDKLAQEGIILEDADGKTTWRRG